MFFCFVFSKNVQLIKLSWHQSLDCQVIYQLCGWLVSQLCAATLNQRSINAVWFRQKGFQEDSEISVKVFRSSLQFET